MEIKNTLIQFIKFGIVGVINTVLSYLITNGCYYALSLHEQVSNTIAFLITVPISFILNGKFTFTKENEKQGWLKPLLKVYASYSITGLFLTAILLHIEEGIFGVPHYIATLINLIITVPLNFLLNKFWVYKNKEEIK